MHLPILYLNRISLLGNLYWWTTAESTHFESPTYKMCHHNHIIHRKTHWKKSDYSVVKNELKNKKKCISHLLFHTCSCTRLAVDYLCCCPLLVILDNVSKRVYLRTNKGVYTSQQSYYSRSCAREFPIGCWASCNLTPALIVLSLLPSNSHSPFEGGQVLLTAGELLKVTHVLQDLKKNKKKRTNAWNLFTLHPQFPAWS